MFSKRLTTFSERHADTMQQALSAHKRALNSNDLADFTKGGEFKDMQNASKSTSIAVAICYGRIMQFLIPDYGDVLPSHDPTSILRLVVTMDNCHANHSEVSSATIGPYKYSQHDRRYDCKAHAQIILDFMIVQGGVIVRTFNRRVFEFNVEHLNMYRKLEFTEAVTPVQYECNIGWLTFLANNSWVKTNTNVPSTTFGELPVDALPYKNTVVDGVKDAIDEYSKLWKFMCGIAVTNAGDKVFINSSSLSNITVPYAPHFISTPKEAHSLQTAMGQLKTDDEDLKTDYEDLKTDDEEGGPTTKKAMTSGNQDLFTNAERIYLVKFIERQMGVAATDATLSNYSNLWSIAHAVLIHFANCYARLREHVFIALCEAVGSACLDMEQPMKWNQLMYQMFCYQCNNDCEDQYKLRPCTINIPGLEIGVKINFVNGAWELLKTFNHSNETPRELKVDLGDQSITVSATIKQSIGFLPTLVDGECGMPTLQLFGHAGITKPIIVAIGSMQSGQLFKVDTVFMITNGRNFKQGVTIHRIPNNVLFREWIVQLSATQRQFAEASRRMKLDCSSVAIAVFDLHDILTDALQCSLSQDLTDDIVSLITSGASIFAYPMDGQEKTIRRNVEQLQEKIRRHAETTTQKRKEMQRILDEEIDLYTKRKKVADERMAADTAEAMLDHEEQHKFTNCSASDDVPVHRSLGASGHDEYQGFSAPPAPPVAAPASSASASGSSSAPTSVNDDASHKPSKKLGSVSMLQSILDYFQANNVEKDYSGCSLSTNPSDLKFGDVKISTLCPMMPPSEYTKPSFEELSNEKKTISECLISASSRLRENRLLDSNGGDQEDRIKCQLIELTCLCAHAASNPLDDLTGGGSDPVAGVSSMINHIRNMFLSMGNEQT